MNDRIAKNPGAVSRREFLKGVAGAAVAMPVIVPSSVFGAGAPSNRITVGCIVPQRNVGSRS